MAAALPFILIGGAILQGIGQYQKGRAARRYGEQVQVDKNFEAAQLEQNATQTEAAAQRDAIEQRRRAALVASRALAVSAASGAGASDPTIENIISDIAGEGAYRSATALYEGEERARRMRMGAEVSRIEGTQAAEYGKAQGRAANLAAFGSLASGAGSLYMKGGSLYEKYGMGGPKAEQPPAPVEDRIDPRFR